MTQEEMSVTSIGEIADRHGVQSWRVARLFELGLVEEPPRISGRRAIPVTLIPHIISALRERGWLQDREPPE